MFLDYFSLFLICFVGIVVFYGIIVIHDIPYEIAVERNHPHQDAIHAGGWVSLFTLHAIWPFLWIWATLYKEDVGWGFNESNQKGNDGGGNGELAKEVSQLRNEMDQLKAQLANNEQPSTDVESPKEES
ncbi:MAG: hypothetical protein DRQ47_02775 [Gammaproteobacteria bacterium]|nr:MAG: hypothetical protein DRQ47_02775 [Gammaproteobacteria bacterium]